MARAYESSDPVAVALDAVGERWALLIVRVLLGQIGPMRFVELQRQLTGISTDVLTRRLRELVGADVVAPALAGPMLNVGSYALTDRGRHLADVLDALSAWGAVRVAATSGVELRSDDEAATGAV